LGPGASSFNSILRTRSSPVPTFSTECGGNGSHHAVNGALGGIPARRESNVTVPASSRRTCSLQLCTCSTPGQRCVCNGTSSPEPIRTSRTRTRSFSYTSRWCRGAATRASKFSGQAHGGKGAASCFRKPDSCIVMRDEMFACTDSFRYFALFRCAPESPSLQDFATLKLSTPISISSPDPRFRSTKKTTDGRRQMPRAVKWQITEHKKEVVDP
jgi:hypothetical protein